MKHFPVYYQNAYDHQIFRGGDMLRGTLTHKYAWQHNGVVLWEYVTSKLHISICRCIDTTVVKVLLSVRSSQTWPFDQVTNVRSRNCLKDLYLHFHKVYS